MVDPVDEDITRRVVSEMLVGGDADDIFRKGYVNIDQEDIGHKGARKGPPGVAVHKARWRNSR